MADKPPAAMPPASEPFPGSRTPGWNDPPPLAFNPMSAAATPGRPRISLNKRVAYPLQGSVTSTTATTKPTAVVLPNQVAGGGMPLPPPPMAVNAATATTIMQPVAVVHPMPPMPLQQQHSAGQQETVVLPADALVVSFRHLRDRVPLVQESVNVRREEIERRLGIIEQLWQSGNLSEGVKQKIYKLSLAVQRNAHNEAMEIYTNLVANHANECTSWAITLRHIVLTIAPTQAAMTTTSATSQH
ncbi:steroid receptor RNA activator 1 [Musca vetustissima]|uniref:steroid receptor RNA activator 1 n=1 Tax=Musca vetustissima TaxID=27455 RepID=UPI002AB79B80|nr:steroid receptor RNA activator 1 [Musca vetustissima]